MKNKFAMGFVAAVLSLALSLAAHASAMESLIDWMKGGIYSYDFAVTTSGPGGAVDKSSGRMAASGENISVYTESIVEGTKMINRIITKDAATYIVDDVSKTVMKLPVSGASGMGAVSGGVSAGGADYANMKQTGSGEGMVNGKKLPYEEYMVESVSTKYYMDNGQVYAIESISGEHKTLMIITNASKTVPPGAFDIPSNYTNISQNMRF